MYMIVCMDFIRILVLSALEAEDDDAAYDAEDESNLREMGEYMRRDVKVLLCSFLKGKNAL